MEAVRTFEPGDLQDCVELTARACREAETVRGGGVLVATAADPAELVRTWVQDDERPSTVLVGLFNDSVVGLAAGTVSLSAHEGRVELCYVEESARAVGVGRALIDQLLAWFKSQRCGAVDALALPGDRETKRLLEAAGFKTRLLVLRAELG